MALFWSATNFDIALLKGTASPVKRSLDNVLWFWVGGGNYLLKNQQSWEMIQRMESGLTPVSSSWSSASIPVFPAPITTYLKLSLITPLSAQISASNFHDLTQITQRRVCFNPKRTEKPKAHGFSVRFGLKHTLREVVVVLIANITLQRGVIWDLAQSARKIFQSAQKNWNHTRRRVMFALKR